LLTFKRQSSDQGCPGVLAEVKLEFPAVRPWVPADEIILFEDDVLVLVSTWIGLILK